MFAGRKKEVVIIFSSKRGPEERLLYLTVNLLEFSRRNYEFLVSLSRAGQKSGH